ncbi:hypothetical protein EKK58_10655 [Candidatus Dependentiae bacterium]|nr:MAG: hypothetical protein EKK58_10655 [Candidatus Dependentiae bacterium]
MLDELARELDKKSGLEFWATSKRADLMIEFLYRFTGSKLSLALMTAGKKVCLDYLVENLPVALYRSPQFYFLRKVTKQFLDDPVNGNALQGKVLNLGTGTPGHTPRAWARLAAFHAAAIYNNAGCARAVAYAFVTMSEDFMTLTFDKVIGEADYAMCENEYLRVLGEIADKLRKEMDMSEVFHRVYQQAFTVARYCDLDGYFRYFISDDPNWEYRYLVVRVDSLELEAGNPKKEAEPFDVITLHAPGTTYNYIVLKRVRE